MLPLTGLSSVGGKPSSRVSTGGMLCPETNPLTSTRKPSPSIATDHRLRLDEVWKTHRKGTRSPLQGAKSSSPCSKRARPAIGVSSSMTHLRARRLFGSSWFSVRGCSILAPFAP
ncbi:hypothetical protein [Mesorhizobium onobrychidis]|uniref:Uncharacterized protein n=1 Tax=Mesorhizobium onobrychidis TaxID=2775404 RepID=A0ABY5QVJ9_9HYPH|nr:hypothetical protein [Mesorhizobium onobrychidis]UVC15245.1 hypothetical protein IHQ72_32620 [Mesorhizobium onobrychidis]